MLVLGIQGSPRKNGNTSLLLNAFMEKAALMGADTEIIECDSKKIIPCKEYKTCETKGYCPINDDMTADIIPRLRNADIVVLASPVFFYSVTAQAKAVIDRSQILWARKYKLGIIDPYSVYRKGVLISVGATKGKNLFEGITTTVKYFFDAIGSSFDASLVYRQAENPGDINNFPHAFTEVKQKAYELITLLAGRKTIFFVAGANHDYAIIACSFLSIMAGNEAEAIPLYTVSDFEKNGSYRAGTIYINAMKEKGIDIEYMTAKPFSYTGRDNLPDLIVAINCDFQEIPENAKMITWHIENTCNNTMQEIEHIRKKVENIISENL